MATLNARQINGVVNTADTVWSNLERLAEAASVWFTYDTHNGVYAWVINQAGNSVASISEADIIGPIQISGSGLTNLYNSVEIEYPRNDMNDQPHYARVDLPAGLRSEYEPDNTLQISSGFINNQPQAEYVGMVTLKQSRLDRTVTIVMDYTKINLQAGDIIDITSDTYAWTAKEFRIMRVREIEGDDGSLKLEFSCTEYDDTIYDGTWNNFLVAGQSGIRSIGAIGTPGTPTIVQTTVDSLPAQAVTTTVPAGVIDRMQFWAGNIAQTGNINTTTFDLVGSVASANAASFDQGDSVVFTTTTLKDGTWVWKTRGINGSGTGAFSTASGNVVYTRNQAPDVIRAGTPVVDNNGNVSTASSVLLAVYNTGNFNNLPQTLPSGTGNLIPGADLPFVVPVDAYYNITVDYDVNSSGATGGRGSAYSEPADYMGFQFEIIDDTATPFSVATQSSGGVGAFGWTDFHLVGTVPLYAGNTYTIYNTIFNTTASNPSANANVSITWQVSSAVLI